MYMLKEKTVGNLIGLLNISLDQSIYDSLKDLHYNRLLTQSEYVTSEDAVISAGWYNHSRIVEESLKKGAVVIFCDTKTKEAFPQQNVIGVDDPLSCVQDLERYLLRNFHGKCITITGSVGKTTTTGLINTIFSNCFRTLTGHSMSNSHGAILRNIQKLTAQHQYWVQEVGAVQPGYIESSACVMAPDVVVLTNIGESHLNTYITKDNIFKDKSSLERYEKKDGVVVINSDDDILRNAEYSHRLITVSLKDSSADYYGKNLSTTAYGLNFTLVCADGEFPVCLKLFGNHNAYNAMQAIAVGRYANIPMGKILELISSYAPSGMRQNMIHVGGYSLLLDVFNAEPKTVIGAAETLMQIPKPDNGKRIFITGHIDKLGKDSAMLHEKLGRDLSALDLDQIVLFAGDSKFTYKGLLECGFKRALLMESREELEEWMRKNITRNDIVAFKSGQFEAALAKSIDHVYGTAFQNEQQYNEGKLVEKDGFIYRLRQDNIAEIEKYTGTDINVEIPSEYDGHVVTRIRRGAFRRNLNLQSIVIPDSVVNIGEEAFYICPKLKHVKLPSSLLYIDKNAFNYCKSLETIEIPSGAIHIGRHAFYDCVNLKSINIPDSVGFLGEDCFAHCTHLTAVVSAGSYVASYFKDNNLNAKFI